MDRRAVTPLNRFSISSILLDCFTTVRNDKRKEREKMCVLYQPIPPKYKNIDKQEWLAFCKIYKEIVINDKKRKEENMLEKLKKLNPINWFEKIIIKRVAKKVVSLFPDIKEKGVKYIEEHKEELMEKIQITILKFIEEHKS